MTSLHHPSETDSNLARDAIARFEPKSLRTYTPTQAVFAQSAGVFHWTPEGRKLFDFSSGVLVANLGHNPARWMKRFVGHMGWSGQPWEAAATTNSHEQAYFPAVTLTAYNGITSLEAQASKRLADLLQSRPGGKRLEHVMWAASGSEAIQKALWAALASDRTRDMILATRFGFHGKKGLAGAVTGCETDRERDPRVRFIGFPMRECLDVSMRNQPFDPSPYLQELEALKQQFGRKLSVLITEPYLGGGGSFHPPKGYLQALQKFCRDNDIVFILDEVQSNFGRTGELFAFETYGIEPDIVVLGKGLGNGVPVAAAVGAADLFASLDYGEGSDTWSANPLCCAAVLATLDEFAADPLPHGRGSDTILANTRKSSALIEEGLVQLKEAPFIAHVRGEKDGMVWGVETRDHAGRTAPEWANAIVLACYLGEGKTGIHLLGPLAKKVIRIAPPLVITEHEARDAMALMRKIVTSLVKSPEPALAATM
ncbi:MAG: aminotransferase class III-fold pyridoxal phosphate-dependent enzyme [Gemmataceae bacterium]|nr:aminotransferase class III-fold pyridoxal phosphate-dependent enzyme [Gemmataceae bacterium]MCI0740201.1 aminotransferase class III-fold pyridoxal phosphate-dependent enzyme [Gemmataceae bacterium]